MTHSAMLAVLLCSASVAATIGVYGCSSSLDGNSSGDLSPEISAADRAAAEKLMNEARISCQGNCPTSVGMVVFTKDRSVERCTGFLIDSSTLATSSRCVPVDLRSKDANCRGRMRVVFPGTDQHPKTEALCETVLFASNIRNPEIPFSRNYAFIRLDRTIPRPPLVISQEGLPDALPVSIIRVNPVSDTIAYGDLQTIACTTVHRSAVMPFFDHPLRPVATLADCNLRSSNTGAPVLDSAGRVRAIADRVASEEFKKRVRKGPPEGDSSISLATNFACIPPLNSPSQEQPESCGQTLTLYDLERRNQTDEENQTKQSEAQFEKAFTDWARQHEDNFQWNWIPTENGRSPIPKCFNRPETWLNEHKNLLGGYRKRSVIPVSGPTWSLTMRQDKFLRWSYDMRTSEDLTLTAEFHPSTLKKTGKSKIKFENAAGYVLFQGELTACK